MQVLISSLQSQQAEALRRLVLEVEHAPAVRIEVRTPDWASPLPVDAPPDLIILDTDGTKPGSEKWLIRKFRTRFPGARLLAAGSRDEDGHVKDILEFGVLGYLPKSYSKIAALGVLRLVLAGDAEGAAANRPRAKPRRKVAGQESGKAAALGDYRLSARKIEVLRLIAEGKRNLEIARRLDITEGTVKLHTTAIYRELGVGTRAEAALIATRMQGLDAPRLMHAEGGDLELDWLLPQMSHKRVAQGTILFRKGDKGTELGYVQRGTLHLQEIDVDLDKGSVFGEIGIFSPSHQRTCTAVCTNDADLFMLTSQQVKRLYLQNPPFAFFLVHLIAKRLTADQARII